MGEVLYISYAEAIEVYHKTIEKSGGGFMGVRDDGGISAVLNFIQNDNYYPTFAEKLSHLVYGFCSGHFFDDGNKRIALTLGVYFLHKNGYHWEACVFMSRFESIIYHVAASRIDKDLLHRVVHSFLCEKDFDESLKLDIARAIDVCATD